MAETRQYPPLRWGLIGASDIAEVRMIPAMRRVGHTVVAVASGSPERAAAYAARNDVGAVSVSADELVQRDDIDAVYVSSVNELHLGQVLAAARAGKHVLCEKPMSPAWADAVAMVEACRAAGVVLGVNHTHPAAGTHRMVHKLVREGAIGEPKAMMLQNTWLLLERLRGWRLGNGPGAGVVLDLAGHDASVSNLILGRALDVMASTARQGRLWQAESEDAAMAIIRYEGDVLVHTHDSFTTPNAPSRVEVLGDQGSIAATEVLTPEPLGRVFLRDERGEREIEVTDRRHPCDSTVERFAGAVAGDGEPYVDGVRGARALAVALAIAESASSGRRAQVPWI